MKQTKEVLSATGQVIVQVSEENSDVKLDLAIKKLLCQKPILACILKNVVSECADMTEDEIIQCIEGEPEIEKVPLMEINGQAQEHSETGKDLVRYDIRTYIKLPNAEKPELAKILINLEAQKEDKPGYDLPVRAIFYCCRIISSELNVEFTNHQNDPKKFQNIKKVYSIWICSNAAQCRANSVDKYSINRETIYGSNDDNPRFDLFNAIIVNISKTHDTEGSDNKMIKVLTDLLNSDLSTRSKIEALKADGIQVTEEIEEGVADMCTYTASVRSEGEARGEARGRAEGQSILVKTIQLLRDGYTEKELLDQGIDKQTIDLAMTVK